MPPLLNTMSTTLNFFVLETLANGRLVCFIGSVSNFLVVKFHKHDYIQGVRKLVCLLWLGISLPNVAQLEYPFNHLTSKVREFFWCMTHQVTGIITLFYVWKCFWQDSPRNGFCVPTQNQIFLCFELEQIWDHIYYTNAPHFYSKCGLGFALAQSIKKIWFCVGPVGTQKPFLGEPCQKQFHT